MSRRLACAIGLAAVLGIAHSAPAKILTVTYSGTVGSGVDSSGVFGAADSSLTGDSYIATFKFNDSEGVRTTIPPFLDSVIGGPFNHDSDPSLGATLTINGVTVFFNGADLGLEENYPLGESVSSYAADLAPAGHFDAGFIGNSLAAPAIPSSLDTAFSSKGTSGTDGFINAFQVANGPGNVEIAFASGILDPENVAVTVTSGVPEPSAWIFMALGFGIVGIASRFGRRRDVPLAKLRRTSLASHSA